MEVQTNLEMIDVYQSEYVARASFTNNSVHIRENMY